MALPGQTTGFWRNTPRFLGRICAEFIPLELAGITCAIGLSWLVFHLTSSYGWGAFSGEVGEFIGYYGYAFTREFRRHTHRPFKATFGRLSEFIPAEIFDWTVGISLASIIPRRFDDYRLGMLVATVTASVLFSGIVLLTRWLKTTYQSRRAIRALIAQSDTPPIAVGTRD